MAANMICIECPLGCEIEAVQSGDVIAVSGNNCKRGEDYAKKELTNPSRTLTTTVRTIFADYPRLPVRSAEEIPLAAVMPAMQHINMLLVEKRMLPGEVVMLKIPATEVPLVATADMTIRDDSGEENLFSERGTGHEQ